MYFATLTNTKRQSKKITCYVYRKVSQRVSTVDKDCLMLFGPAKPNANTTSGLVDGTHDSNLLTSFFSIGLIDAELIDP
jgi:hypothetical protein